MKAVAKQYPHRSDMILYLESLYSAYFTGSVERIGESHLVFFDMSMIDDHYTLEQENLLEKSFQFINEVLFNPLFDSSVFEEEKRLLEEYFQSVYSNKFAYAVKLLNETMFEKESFKITSLGKEEDIPSISLDDVINQYSEMIQTDNITITVVGDIDFSDIENLVKQYLPFEPRDNQLNYLDYETKEVTEVIQKVVTQDITQAKFSFGYRLPVYYDTELYNAALVFNTLFGATAEAMLHMRIREELGLCYYIGSNYSSHKGVLFVHAGIDPSKKDTVLQETSDIINKIIAMDYDDSLLDIAKKSNIAGIIESKDSNSSLAIRIERMSFYGKQVDFEQKIDEINKVTKEQVSKVASLLILDTTMLLRGEK
jgi:predicted Zn-dependent peptidase